MGRKQVGLRRWSGVVVLVWLAMPAQAVPGAAAAEPQTSVEQIGATTPELLAAPLKLTVEAIGKQEKGELTVPLRAKRSGTLEAEFTDMASRETIEVGSSTSSKLAIIGLAADGPDVPAGETYVLHLTFTTRAGGLDELEGVLRVGTGVGAPLDRIVEAVSAKAPEPGWRPTQDKVEITATRLFPLFGVDDSSRTIGVAAPSETTKPGTEPLAESYASPGSSGSAKVTVSSPADMKGKIRKAELKVTDASGVGTATTKLDFGDEQKAGEQLEVEVKVGDSLLAPVLVLLLGALLGKFGTSFYDVWRSAQLLRRRLAAAVEKYEDAPGDLPKRDGKAVNFGLESIAEEVGKAKKLIGRLWRVGYIGDVEEQSAIAEPLINIIEGWVSIREALLMLAKADDRPADLDEDEGVETLMRPPLRNSRELLHRQIKVDDELDKSKRIAKRIQAQATAVTILWRIAVLAESLRKDKNIPPAPWLAEAGAAYAAAKAPMARSEEEATVLVEGLRDVLAQLNDRWEGWEQTVDTDRESVRRVGLDFHIVNTPSRILVSAFESIGPRKAPTPARIAAGIRRGDWIIAGMVLVLTGLAYFIPEYGDAPFGTWQQYLTVFAIGAVSQFAFTATLIPFTRSLKSGSAPAAEPKTEAKAA